MGDEEFRQPGTGFEDSGGYGWPYGSNTFARQPNRNDPLLQLMTNRIRPLNSTADTSRGFRRLALSNLYTPQELSTPRGTTYADYATRGELEARRKKVVSAQMDQLHALDAQLGAIRGQTKEAARTKALDAKHRRLVGSLSGGSPTADLLGIIGTEVVLGIADSKREQQRRRNILNVGRRGAAATRALSTTGSSRTNRTGAKSTRAIDAIRTAPGGTGTLSAAKMGRSGRNSVAKGASESAQSKAARAVLAQTTPLPRAAARTPTQPTRRTSLFNTPTRGGMSQLLSQLLSPRARVRAPVRAGASSPMRVSAAAPAAAPGTVAANLLPQQGLETALTSQLSASPPDRCNCPKPEKPRKKKFDCSNPIISRSVSKDGVITIKRKLQCPPSKPK